MDYLKYLLDNDIACMMRDGDKIIKELKGRGIMPLYLLYKDGTNYSNCILTDKVIGIGAANLCVLLKVKEVETKLISKNAYHILEQNHIKVTYKELTDYILNNRKEDFCPLEKRFLNNEMNLAPISIIENFIDSMKS